MGGALRQMHVALHNVLVDQHLQRLVARVLVHVERVAVLGDLAALLPLAFGVAVGEQAAEVDHVVGVAHLS